jgi:YbbR domain-containing protein
MIDNPFTSPYRTRYTVSTGLHREEIAKQISSEIKIISIKPDSLVFNFSKIVARKVKVKPQLKLNFENQYFLEDEPSAFPDSLLLSGPQNVLDTVKFISTEFREFDKLNHTLEKIVAIQPIKGTKTEVSEVKLLIPVEQNTEVSFDIPIQVVNNPPEMVLKAFPGKVKVTCRIGLSKYKKLDYSAFKAFVNYDKISGKESRLAVNFENHSKVVMSVSYAPREVEYILEHEK